jgi:sec-independent protein translocase protein TatA
MLAIPGGPELFVVLGVILLLFGSTKLPKLARSLGASVTEFKKGIKSGEGDSGGDEPKHVTAPKGDGKDEPDPSES